jgi:hypothetical protein
MIALTVSVFLFFRKHQNTATLPDHITQMLSGAAKILPPGGRVQLRNQTGAAELSYLTINTLAPRLVTPAANTADTILYLLPIADTSQLETITRTAQVIWKASDDQRTFLITVNNR